MALDGSTALVGAPYKNSQRGAAYVFVRTGTVWVQQAELTVAVNATFGWSTAISGSTALIGAFTNFGTGAAYVFVQSGTTWIQQAKLTAFDNTGTDFFAYSVAISGGTALVGASQKNGGVGAVYVFVRSGTTWSPQAELMGSDTVSGDLFGNSLGLSGSTAVVGALNNGSRAGAAYIFVRSGIVWSQYVKLTASDASGGDLFGYSVSISGATMVVGAVSAALSRGAAYVFVRAGTTWSQLAKLTASDGAASDQFGWSVATSGLSVMVGAPAKNSNLGAVYAYGLP